MAAVLPRSPGHPRGDTHTFHTVTHSIAQDLFAPDMLRYRCAASARFSLRAGCHATVTRSKAAAASAMVGAALDGAMSCVLRARSCVHLVCG
jgi:hypothetical protein